MPGAVSALGFNDVVVELHGLVDNSSVLTVRGTSPETSLVRFTARLSLMPIKIEATVLIQQPADGL